MFLPYNSYFDWLLLFEAQDIIFCALAANIISIMFCYLDVFCLCFLFSQENCQLEVQLFKLYHNEQSINHLTNELKAKSHDLDKLEKRKTEIDQQLKSRKQDNAKFSREMASVEKKITGKVPTFLKARLHRRFLSQQLNAIFVAPKLQLQNHTCKPLCDFGTILAIYRRGMRYNS